MIMAIGLRGMAIGGLLGVAGAIATATAFAPAASAQEPENRSKRTGKHRRESNRRLLWPAIYLPSVRIHHRHWRFPRPAD